MSEHDEQVALFEWVEVAKRKYPVLELLHAIPNGGHRHIAVAKKLKKEGVKAGVPDVCLPVPRGPYHGLYIELKAGKGRLSKKQQWWAEKLSEAGYKAETCWGVMDAINTLKAYINLKDQ